MRKHIIQIVLVITGSIAFLSDGAWAGLSALYGGVISLVNTWLIARHIAQQKLKPGANAGQSFRMLLASVAIRMTVVVVLLVIGFWLLKLTPLALIAGFVIGQLGFLLDRGFSGN